MANKIQIKRTSVSGRAANTTTLVNAGELALNMTDGILYSTNGTSVFEIGANNTNVNVTGTITVKAVSANGGIGTSGYFLASNGTSTYWAPPTSTLGAINYAQNNVSTSQYANTTDSFPKTIVSQPFTTNGNPVQIIVSGDANPLVAGAWGTLQLYRDSTAIGGKVNFESSAANENNPYSLQFIDTPATGTYTYSLKCTQVSGGNAQFGEASGPVLSLVELQNVPGLANAAAQYTWTNTHTFANTVTIDNNQRLAFAPLAGGSNVSFVQQNDDNFVFYSSNTTNGQRAVFSIYANSVTSNLGLFVPLQFNTNSGIVANGVLGSTGQALLSNSTGGLYWGAVASGAGGSNTNIQFNDSGSANGVNALSYDKTTGVLTVGNSTVNATTNSTVMTIGTSIVNTTVLAAGANVYANTTTLRVGNTLVNTVIGNTSIGIGNTTVNATVNSIGLFTGTTTANSSVLAAGANVYANVTSIYVGNSLVNTIVGNASVILGNTTVNLAANSTALVVGTSVVNSTILAAGSNVIANTSTIAVGNSTVNTTSNSTAFRSSSPYGSMSVGWNAATGSLDFTYLG